MGGKALKARKTERNKDSASFSSLLFINECLLDEERTAVLQKAVARKVKPGDLVIDAGTGSGILALFAAAAGARKVYAVESDAEAVTMARRSIGASKYSRKIEIVEADIKDFTLPQPADVLIMEMLDTGLVAEQQVTALNAMRKNEVINSQTRLLPERANCAVEMAEYDFNFYGFNMPVVVQARNSGAHRHLRRLLSNPLVYLEIDFGIPIPTEVEISQVLCAEQDGQLNSLRLRTETVFCDGLSMWETTDMNMPVIIPLETMSVRKDEEVNLTLRYSMGSGYRNLFARVVRARRKPRGSYAGQILRSPAGTGRKRQSSSRY